MKKILYICLLSVISFGVSAQTQINALPSGTWSGNEAPKVFNQKIQLSYTAGGGFPSFGTVVAGGGTTTSQDAGAFQLYFPSGPNFGGVAPRVRMGKWDNAGWTSWSTFYTSANANSLTADWNAKKLLVNDNLGIGTTTPESPLSVAGAGYFRDGQHLDITFGRPGAANGIILNVKEYTGYSRFNLINYSHNTVSRRYVSLGFHASPSLSITKQGRLGIGTNQPTAKLHVNNGNDSYGAILANSSQSLFGLYTKTLGSTANAEMFRLGLKYNSIENNGFISFYRGGSSTGGFLGFSTNGSERIRITKTGNVGIGTATPDEKLVVDGSVRSEEVRVEVVGAPDYVFAPAYELITLEEVEEYIDEHSHLPEIPSAVEMETEGVELGVMNMRLLKKIEELTLYTIDQEKRLLKQQEKIKTLETQQAQINLLAKELQALKQAIKKD